MYPYWHFIMFELVKFYQFADDNIKLRFECWHLVVNFGHECFHLSASGEEEKPLDDLQLAYWQVIKSVKISFSEKVRWTFKLIKTSFVLRFSHDSANHFIVIPSLN